MAAAQRRAPRQSCRYDRTNTRLHGQGSPRNRVLQAVDPAAIIAKLTEQASTFTRADLVRHLWKHYRPT